MKHPVCAQFFKSTLVGALVVAGSLLATSPMAGALTPSSVSISNLPSSGIFNGSFTPTVSTDADGTTSVTSSTTSICTVANGVVSYVGVGTCTLVAHVASGTNYSNLNGESQSFAIAGSKPSAPGVPSLVDNHGSFSVTWTAPSNTGGYAVTYAVEEKTNYGTFTQVASGLSVLRFTFVGTSALNTYSFAIVAVNSIGRSLWSTPAWLEAAAVVASAPGTPSITDRHGSLALSWAAPSNTGGDNLMYVVKEKINNGSYVQVASGLTLTQFTVRGTLAGNTYSFMVAATNTAGRGSWSPVASLRAVATLPSAPLTLNVRSGKGFFYVNWTASLASGGDTLSYTVKEKLNNGAWTQVYSGHATSTYTGAVSKANYIFEVSAVNSAGQSAWLVSGPVRGL